MTDSTNEEFEIEGNIASITCEPSCEAPDWYGGNGLICNPDPNDQDLIGFDCHCPPASTAIEVEPQIPTTTNPLPIDPDQEVVQGHCNLATNAWVFTVHHTTYEETPEVIYSITCVT